MPDDIPCYKSASHHGRRLKISSTRPILFVMINPISGTQASQANQVLQPAARQPQPQAQTPKGSAPQQDTVTLKSTGDVDHDGDSK
jgi:hypothetical protein